MELNGMISIRWLFLLISSEYFLYCSCDSLKPSVVQVQCTSRVVSITLTTPTDFNGVLYAGAQNKDCRIAGKGQRKLEFSLPIKQCGIITVKSPDDATKVIHKVPIYVQQHPMLQRDADLRTIQECVAAADISSEGEGTIMDANKQQVEIIAPGWMEMIRGGRPEGHKIREPVRLGETISILVKAHVKANQDAMVTKCIATDGTSLAPEMLINEYGCPVDDTVMPAFSKISSDNSLLTFWTKFPAFKFPDRNRLYLTCQIAFCDNACPQPRCIRKSSRGARQVVNPNDQYRPAKSNELDVANSVQVVTSDLDQQINTDPYTLEEKDENRICWPLKNLMTAIGILAAILLIALVLALCFWWNRRQRKRKNVDESYGTNTNSNYNPSTNYYYMDNYGNSQQYSQNGRSAINGGQSATQHARPYRSETTT